MKNFLKLMLVVGLAGGCAQVPPEMQAVNAAADALGGRDRILAVNTLLLEGTGTNGNLGQNVTPDGALPSFDIKDFKRTIDLENRRARQQQTRVPTAPGANPQPQVQNFGVDGDVAFNAAPDGMVARQPELVARERRVEFLLHHPVGIIRAALDPAAKLSNPRKAGDLDVVEVTTAQGDMLTLAVDGTTHLPVSVTSMSYNANLGDVAIETAFANYQEVDGLKLPGRLTTKTDKYPTADITVSKNTVNSGAAEIAAPAEVKSGAAPTPTAMVTAEEIGKGIWFLAGGSHNSVLVEFADHLELIEAPQNDTRALAVIAKVRELKADKPLTKVLVSHHHFDHSGGIRAAIAAGLTLVTHETNKTLFEDLAARKHSVVQDALAKNPKPVQIETVGDEAVVKDAARTMEIYHVDGSNHAESMVMVYFPAERLLVQADLYNPANPNAARLPNLIENIQKRKLRVDTHVPLHGPVTTQAQFTKVLETLKVPSTTSN
jgi:glyoxylase-like metal-dependent hydrolase (beta-lactamase superfamily II)